MAASEQYSCGVDTAGDLHCWGLQLEGHPAQPSGKFASVSDGEYGSCALRPNGAWACWGQLGDFIQQLTRDGPVSSIVTNWAGFCTLAPNGNSTCFPSGKYKSISGAAYNVCGVTSDAKLACAGSNTYLESHVPARAFDRLMATDRGFCSVLTDGTPQCWGQG